MVRPTFAPPRRTDGASSAPAALPDPKARAQKLTPTRRGGRRSGAKAGGTPTKASSSKSPPGAHAPMDVDPGLISDASSSNAATTRIAPRTVTYGTFTAKASASTRPVDTNKRSSFDGTSTPERSSEQAKKVQRVNTPQTPVKPDQPKSVGVRTQPTNPYNRSTAGAAVAASSSSTSSSSSVNPSSASQKSKASLQGQPEKRAAVFTTNGMVTAGCSLLLDPSVSFEGCVFFLHAHVQRTADSTKIDLSDTLDPSAPVVHARMFNDSFDAVIDGAARDCAMLRIVARPSPMGIMVDFMRPIERSDAETFERDSRKSKAAVKRAVAVQQQQC